MELRRSTADGRVAATGEWAGPFPSGAPAIFASVAARLGAETALGGAIGDDAFGHALIERLTRDGVDVGAVRTVPGRATAVAFVAYDPAGGRDFWFSVHDSAATAIDRAAVEALWPRVDWLHVSGSTLGFGGAMADAVEATAQHVLRNGGKLSVDPNARGGAGRERLARLARHAHVLFPAEGEHLPTDGLIVETRGAAGALVGGVPVTAPRVTEVDPTGAGDTFAAAFVVALRGGAEPVAAAERACELAARSVEHLGAMEAPVR